MPLTGYHFTNASKNDKNIVLIFNLLDGTSRSFNVTFPKCAITYVFLFNESSTIKFAMKSANNFQDAMNHPNFSQRITFSTLTVNDTEKKTINFLTQDSTDQTFNQSLFNINCTPTDVLKLFIENVRQSVVNGNAGTIFTWWDTDVNPVTGNNTPLVNPPIGPSESGDRQICFNNQTTCNTFPIQGVASNTSVSTVPSSTNTASLPTSTSNVIPTNPQGYIP